MSISISLEWKLAGHRHDKHSASLGHLTWKMQTPSNTILRGRIHRKTWLPSLAPGANVYDNRKTMRTAFYFVLLKFFFNFLQEAMGPLCPNPPPRSTPEGEVMFPWNSLRIKAHSKLIITNPNHRVSSHLQSPLDFNNFGRNQLSKLLSSTS